MDVKTAYLKAPLDETVYMAPPEGWERPANNGIRHVIKLKNSLYGLKQSDNNWNRHVDAWFKSQSFTPSGADPCLCRRHD
ncbi:unnamed protein product, partial [Phaeothamnion confervicola]